MIGLTGGHESPLAGLGLASTFLPAITVLVVGAATGERPLVRRDLRPLRYLPVALVLMPGILHAVALPVLAASGPIEWHDWLTPAADGLYHTPVSRGWGVLTLQGLAARITLNAVVGLAGVSVLVFFEEIGWRAWLLPRLSIHLGPRRAVVATSVIWALWHVPFQLSGIQHVDGVSPTELAVGMPLGIGATGLVLGWLWLRTENVWLVSLAHGALNNWGQYAFKYMKDAPAAGLQEQLAGDLQAVGAGFATLAVVGVVLLWLAMPASIPHRSGSRE